MLSTISAAVVLLIATIFMHPALKDLLKILQGGKSSDRKVLFGMAFQEEL